jgi:hypothetical protein
MAKTKKMRAPVSLRAVIQRINRKLRPDKTLKASRGEPARLDVGAFYVVDHRTNAIQQRDVDLEALARELGVLKPWEEVRE